VKILAKNVSQQNIVKTKCIINSINRHHLQNMG